MLFLNVPLLAPPLNIGSIPMFSRHQLRSFRSQCLTNKSTKLNKSLRHDHCNKVAFRFPYTWYCHLGMDHQIKVKLQLSRYVILFC